MKRFLAILLTMLLVALGIPTLAEGNEWEFNEARCLLTAYRGAGGDVSVPEKIGAGTVKTLDTGALAQVSGMTSLTLPETVMHMKDNAASWNPDLVQVTLPQSLMILGSNCFNDCDSLESVTIPAGVRYIGNGVFSDSEILKDITFEGVCPTFDGEAFTYIAEDAIAYVPDDQLEAYQAAFAAMDNEISVQPSGKSAVIVNNDGFRAEDFDFDAATGTIVKYNGAAVYLCIPETIDGVQVQAIGENAFQFNYDLAYIALPEGLTSIESGALSHCNTLLHVTFPTTLQTIADDAFAGGSYKGYTLDLPSVQTIGARAFEHARLRNVLTLPEGLTDIGEGAFTSTSLYEVYLPASLKSIGSMAFAQNWSLNYIYMDGEALPAIAADAFVECTALEDIDLNEHCTKQQMLDVQAIVDDLGLDCRVWRCENSLVDHFNDDLDTYADGFLTSYTGTETRVRPWSSCNKVQTIGIADGVFKGSQTLEIFAVPHSDNFTTIGAEAFMDSTLRIVDLFDSVTTIGARAFANCAQLEELTIPESVTSIGEGAFDGLTALKKVTILCDPALIPDGSFMANGEPISAQMYLAADASDDQLAQISNRLQRPWYDPAMRAGQPSAFIKMPFVPTPADSFEFDAATGTLMAYTGTDVDVVIPREIDGVAVTAIDRNAFEACRDYTNTETASDRTEWVHLRSVVIPETVRNIGDDLFSYCQQLETVICYAPLETTGGTTFMLCRSLNNVIFVNGVRTIGSYAFDSAGPLNNLYFGKHLDRIEDYAFNFSGISSFVADATEIGFSFPNCESLTSLHFTAKVKLYNENLASDCPNLREICFESSDLSGVVNGGLVFKPADQLTVRVPADTDEENLNKAQNCVSWSDKATEVTVLTEACGHTAPALMDVTALMPNAALEAGVEIPTAEATDEAPAAEAATAEAPAAEAPAPEAPAAEAPAADSAIPAEYVGTWYGVSMSMDGTEYSLADLGMDMVITIAADGTMQRTMAGETETAVCAVDHGTVILDGVPATVSDGILTVQEDGVILTLSQEKPEASAPEAPAMPKSDTEAPAEAIEAPAVSGFDPAIYLEKKLIMTDADMNGYNMTAEMLGGYEYSLVFHADGTVDFTMAGAEIPGLTWTTGAIETDQGSIEGFIIDYYTDKLNVVPTETGMDMNYFDSMLMHFAVQE